MEARCYVQLLGNLRVTQGERLITRFRDRKSSALFAYLVYFNRRPHSREELLDLFWPDSETPAGRASLSTALSALHKQLEPPGIPKGTVLFADRHTVQCNPDAFTSDVAEFEVLLHRADHAPQESERLRLRLEAVEHYGGELLLSLYDDWILTERIRLQTIYLEALSRIAAAWEEAQSLERAIETAQKIAAVDPLHEEAHETLIRLYTAVGQPDAARRQYRDLTRILQKETGTTPDTTLWEGISRSEKRTEAAPHNQAVQENSPTAPPAPDIQQAAAESFNAAQDARLPLRLTRFFGRGAEIAALCERLSAREIRLLTITGSGGNGKTRIAVEVAERLMPDWDNHVWFVPLAEINTPCLIPDLIRVAMRLPREPGSEPLEQVVRTLNQKPALLVLDNFEQLLAAPDNPAHGNASVALIAVLLSRVPSLTCLVTSRQLLDIGGEHEFQLLPLPTPKDSAKQRERNETPPPAARPAPPDASPETLMNYPSVRLFVDRAQNVKPYFQITENNAAAIAALCDRLEGIPLALELAAARAQVMTPAQMIKQLEAPFDFLASRRKDLAPRHQTLFKAVDWSYRLLAPPFRDFFARLSVFRGGWTIEAAEAVCNDFGPATLDFGLENAFLEAAPLSQNAVPDEQSETLQNPKSKIQNEPAQNVSTLDYLAQLRHISLILAEEHGEIMRFRMLEMLRIFAAVQLNRQERDDVQRRHAEYFLHFAETAEPELTEARQKFWLERLEAEYENLRAALRGLIEMQETQNALRICGALGRFWWVRGYRREGQEWLRQALALPNADAPTLARAAVLRWYGFFLGFQESGRPERPCYEESLALFRQHQHSSGTMEMLLYLGDSYMVAGEGEQAEAYYLECHALAEAHGEKHLLARAHTSLAHLLEQRGNRSAFLAHMEAALDLQRSLDNPRGIALALLKLGRFEPDEAVQQQYYEESLRLFRELGDPWGVGSCLHVLAIRQFNRDNLSEAALLYEEARDCFRPVGSGVNLVGVYTGLAETRFRLGERETAFALLKEVEQIAGEMDAAYRCSLLFCRAILHFENEETPAALHCLRRLFAPQMPHPKFSIYQTLTLCARFAVAAGRPQFALTALAAQQSEYVRLQMRRSTHQQSLFNACLARARELLPLEDDYERLWQEGGVLSEDALLACIRALLQ